MADQSQLELWADEFATDETTSARHNTPRLARIGSPSTPPARFVQQLASQIQLLACLKWLGEFQVLALIPLRGNILVTEVAELAGVPRMQLSRVVRMTGTADFLHEPQPGYVAHTSLSAAFVTDFSLIDAAMFLAESAAPTALHMAAVTQRRNSSNDSAYSIALNTSQPFHAACASQPRLQRQWTAYRDSSGDTSDSFIELLGRLNWRSLGNACIVDVCAQSTERARTLAGIYPALRFIVQMVDPDGTTNPANGCEQSRSTVDGRITLQQRMPAGIQAVNDAAVYILHLPTLSRSLRSSLQDELNAHLGVLRANPSATMILAPPLLPEPGSVNPDVEAMARLRDLAHQQLTNEFEWELSELIQLVNGTQDSTGRLIVANKLASRNGATAAVSIKYELSCNNGNLQPSRTPLNQCPRWVEHDIDMHT